MRQRCSRRNQQRREKEKIFRPVMRSKQGQHCYASTNWQGIRGSDCMRTFRVVYQRHTLLKSVIFRRRDCGGLPETWKMNLLWSSRLRKLATLHRTGVA